MLSGRSARRLLVVLLLPLLLASPSLTNAQSTPYDPPLVSLPLPSSPLPSPPLPSSPLSSFPFPSHTRHLVSLLF
ncbi:unnamed protein product [Closterium sp. NIES-53]